jgi:pantetheine-phosphate adenylyltransferase
VRIALYPGTFDPVTLGHVDLVERGRRLFDRIIVAVADSSSKGPLFDVRARVELFQRATEHIDEVQVVPFSSLTVQFAREQGACAILRGLRAVSDFDYEFQLAWMNRKLDPQIETVFLCPNEHYSYVNSTLVKEIARLGGDVTEFVPPTVHSLLLEKLGRR